MKFLRIIGVEVARLIAFAIILSAISVASATVWKWSQTPGLDATADSTINWAEGMAPSAVNDSARAMMAAIAKWRDDLSGTKITTGGVADAYTVTSNQGLTALTDGFRVSFIISATNTGASTLAVDGLAAKPLRVTSGAALPGGAVVANQSYTAAYDSVGDEWLLDGYFGNQTIPSGAVVYTASAALPSGWLRCDGTSYTTAAQSALFAAIGYQYGGSGANFNVPDVRARLVWGNDPGATGRFTGSGIDVATLGATGGSPTTTVAQANLPAVSFVGTSGGESSTHTHGFTAQTGSGSNFTYTAGGAGATSDAVPGAAATGGQSVGHTHSLSVSSGGSGTALTNIPPGLNLNCIIKSELWDEKVPTQFANDNRVAIREVA